jgi:hypothetical protein
VTRLVPPQLKSTRSNIVTEDSSHAKKKKNPSTNS